MPKKKKHAQWNFAFLCFRIREITLAICCNSLYKYNISQALFP